MTSPPGSRRTASPTRAALCSTLMRQRTPSRSQRLGRPSPAAGSAPTRRRAAGARGHASASAAVAGRRLAAERAPARRARAAAPAARPPRAGRSRRVARRVGRVGSGASRHSPRGRRGAPRVGSYIGRPPGVTTSHAAARPPPSRAGGAWPLVRVAALGLACGIERRGAQPTSLRARRAVEFYPGDAAFDAKREVWDGAGARRGLRARSRDASARRALLQRAVGHVRPAGRLRRQPDLRRAGPRLPAWTASRTSASSSRSPASRSKLEPSGRDGHVVRDGSRSRRVVAERARETSQEWLTIALVLPSRRPPRGEARARLLPPRAVVGDRTSTTRSWSPRRATAASGCCAASSSSPSRRCPAWPASTPPAPRRARSSTTSRAAPGSSTSRSRPCLAAAGFPRRPAPAARARRAGDRDRTEWLRRPPTATSASGPATIAEQWPGRRLILVGDSGEHDPELYGRRSHARWPDRIERILIHDVTGEPRDAVRYRAAFARRAARALDAVQERRRALDAPRAAGPRAGGDATAAHSLGCATQSAARLVRGDPPAMFRAVPAPPALACCPSCSSRSVLEPASAERERAAGRQRALPRQRRRRRTSSSRRFEGESREIAAQCANLTLHLGLRPGMAVADIGAGTGLFMEELAHGVGRTGKVYAVDIAPAFIEHLRRARRGGRAGPRARRPRHRALGRVAGRLDRRGLRLRHLPPLRVPALDAGQHPCRAQAGRPAGGRGLRAHARQPRLGARARARRQQAGHRRDRGGGLPTRRSAAGDRLERKLPAALPATSGRSRSRDRAPAPIDRRGLAPRARSLPHHALEPGRPGGRRLAGGARRARRCAGPTGTRCTRSRAAAGWRTTPRRTWCRASSRV